MHVIGITGPVGSGKSTVAQWLQEQYHALWISTDQLAKESMQKGAVVYQRVCQIFGSEILDAAAEIDREKLAAIVFVDRKKLECLNQATHPFVMEQVKQILQEQKGQKRFCVIESALLIEAGYQPLCDECWYVYVPEPIRRARLRQERGYSDQRIDQILKNQKTDAFFRAHCTKIIENQDKKEALHAYMRMNFQNEYRKK